MNECNFDRIEDLFQNDKPVFMALLNVQRVAFRYDVSFHDSLCLLEQVYLKFPNELDLICDIGMRFFLPGDDDEFKNLPEELDSKV